MPNERQANYRAFDAVWTSASVHFARSSAHVGTQAFNDDFGVGSEHSIRRVRGSTCSRRVARGVSRCLQEGAN